MTVNIRHGVDDLNLDVAGLSVGQIRERTHQALGLSGNEQARIDGMEVENHQRVEEGQSLELVKVAGEKGRKA